MSFWHLFQAMVCGLGLIGLSPAASAQGIEPLELLVEVHQGAQVQSYTDITNFQAIQPAHHGFEGGRDDRPGGHHHGKIRLTRALDVTSLPSYFWTWNHDGGEREVKLKFFVNDSTTVVVFNPTDPTFTVNLHGCRPCTWSLNFADGDAADDDPSVGSVGRGPSLATLFKSSLSENAILEYESLTVTGQPGLLQGLVDLF